MRPFPAAVTKICYSADAWIVGSAAVVGADLDSLRDIDIVVPFHKWKDAALLIPEGARPNTFGGWKFTEDETGKVIDVWPGDMTTLMAYGQFTWAWHLVTGHRVARQLETGYHMARQMPTSSVTRKIHPSDSGEVPPPISIFDRLRGTGRTTRMLFRAKELSDQRRAVYIVTHNDVYARALTEEITKLFGDTGHGIKVEPLCDLRNFDMTTMRLRGAHPNCVVLVDHFAIEFNFGAMLDELHAYDPPAIDWIDSQPRPVAAVYAEGGSLKPDSSTDDLS